MSSSTPSPLPSNGSRNGLPLPPELLLKIFHELVSETGSSAWLVPCMYTCKVFHNILTAEPALWTRLSADMDTANPPATRTADPYWPHLDIALRLSQRRPFSLVVNFITGLPLHPTDWRDHERHFADLIYRILTRNSERCEELSIHSSHWRYVKCVLNNLEWQTINYPWVTFPNLRRLEIQFLPLSPDLVLDANNARSCFTPLDVNTSFLDDPTYISLSAKEEHNDRMFPNLREIVISNFLLDREFFSATRLTSLRFANTCGDKFQLEHDQLKDILMLNSNTLTVLDLGLWGIGSVLNGFSAERYTLPVLEELKLTINFYRDFVVFVQKIDLPSLKRLSILDDYNLYLNWSPLHRPTISNRNFPTDCLEGYTAMMDFWPLEQVTELALKFIILHEMEGNRISRLRPSHKEQELWEGGYPLATRFFYRFSSVRSLVLQGVDATTSDAIWVPPRRYNPALGTFDDVVPLFPSCPRPPGYVD